ncbi:MAG: hypothetical protein LRY73_00875 [Bacillus sp. (in: Bacteria)]|nr:hypothetical protein [Bacillus sp. (in: firmicutes)]
MSKKEERFLRRLSEFPRNKMDEETKQRMEATISDEEKQTAFLVKGKEQITMFKKVAAVVLTVGVLLAVILILPNQLNWNQSTPSSPEDEERTQNDDEVDQTGDDQKEEQDNGREPSDETKEDNDKEETKENDDTIPNPDAENVLRDYRETTEAIFESREDDLRIPGFDSKRDMVEHVNSVMSLEHGRWFAETYFEEREDGLFVIPMDGLVYLVEDEAYDVEQLSEREYQVIQERDSEMLGHIKMIYQLVYDGENWVVDSVDSEDVS